MAPTVLHLSPHPDDEVLGAGPTLTLLRDAGCRVVNLACGLGRPSQWEQRRAEVEVAVERLGIELVVSDPPLALSADDDLEASERALVHQLRGMHRQLRFDLVVSPQEADGHHGHEVVGRAVRRWIVEAAEPVTWWAWGLWAEVVGPSLVVPYDDERLVIARHALHPEIVGVPFWADSALLAAAGIPTVVYGPGGGGFHSEVEWVDLASAERCAEVYLSVAEAWCA